MWRLIRRWLVRLVVLAVLASLALTAPLRWLNPPTSAFMLADRLAGQPVRQQFVPIDGLPAYIPLAVVAAEDQNFPHHRGFDLGEIQSALATHRDGGRLRGASTISQQTARNLYLWSDRGWVRKGLESWFTAWLELTLPKRRILELHLNIAEFDTGVYGIQVAAGHYFGIDANRLTPAQAALLAASLPAPKRLNPAEPDAYLVGRQHWILGQMANLGEHWVP